jgi:hypothetical protein
MTQHTMDGNEQDIFTSKPSTRRRTTVSRQSNQTTQTTTTTTNTEGQQETTITTTVTNPTTDPGIQQFGTIEVDYWRIPHKPNWDYVIVNQKPLYSTTHSTNFELHPSEEETLVMRILELAGVVIEKENLQQSIMIDKANTKQEQNR